MDIAVLVLSVGAILLLVAIFALLILKFKQKNTNIDDNIKRLGDEQRDKIVQDIGKKFDSANNVVLGEISRNNTALSTGLTTTVSANNSTLNQTLDNFRDTQEKKFTSLETKLAEKLKNIHDEMTNALHSQKMENVQSNNDIREVMSKKLTNIEKEIATQLKDLKEENVRYNNSIKDLLQARLGDIDKEISGELEKIRTENQTKLDQMREVVDTKMQQTLNDRINESFKVISEQLLAVSKGLGEMTNLTSGVNNLNKIMSNVKTRGMWGEISLQNLLEQILTADQYKEQVSIKGREMVDFAVILPAKKDDEKIYLPIDAKFPLADYQLLVEAEESYDKEKVDSAKKNLFKRIKEEAKSISTKYIDVPKTTNFAIMYLPIEGLFAEVVRDSVLLDELQNKYKVVISGPTTITALLNSLQLGFKTLQIQKSSKDVWNALSQFRTEFQKFADSLEKVKKQANTVVTTIDDTSKKTKKIEKVLNNLGKIDFNPDEMYLIGGEDNAEADADN